MTTPEQVTAVLVVGLLVLLAYLAMWRGWQRRGRKHDLPELAPVPAEADATTPRLSSSARYFGTTVGGSWLDRVVARGLGLRSQARILLSAAGVDVVRAPGSFRIPAAALRGARHDQGIAGKVVPPSGVLVLTWRHGDYLLDSGFRLDEPTSTEDGSITEAHNRWVRAVTDLVQEHAA